MSALANKVAIIAGASSGIGYATAELFAREGAKLVVGARRKAELSQLVAAIGKAGGEAIALAGDVADEDYAQALVGLAVENFGGLDVAFNNAGMIAPMGPTTGIALADWRRTLDVNLTSAFLAAKYQLPAMVARGGGSLIFTSSFVGYTVSFPGIAAYSASKSGLIGLTQSLAVEFAQQNVRVNTLLPGATDATVLEARAGLRPAAPDQLPVLGSDPDTPNIVHASGHYRNGVLLAPITAKVIGDLIVDGKRDRCLDAFAPSRFF